MRGVSNKHCLLTFFIAINFSQDFSEKVVHHTKILDSLSVAFPFKVHAREVIQKCSKVEKLILHITHHIALIYACHVSSKYLKVYKSYGAHKVSTFRFFQGR